MTDIFYDGNSLFARAWFAVTNSGAVENAVEEASKAALVSAITLLNPEKIGRPIDRALFCWDAKDGHKSDKKRSPKPTEFHETLALVQDCLSLLTGAPNVCIPGYEADDLVATAVLQSTADHKFVVSGDKDLHQLKSKSVDVFCLHTKALIAHRDVISKWHIKRPNQVAIALAIIGDRVDGISGIKGWGEAKVKKLFESVTPEMHFQEALETVDRQIPEHLKREFYESLDMVLLNNEVPGVPNPAPLRLASIETAASLQLPGLVRFYETTYKAYHEMDDVENVLEKIGHFRG